VRLTTIVCLPVLRQQARAAEQQRFEVHRSFRRHAAVVEEHRRRMGVKDGVASRLRVPSAAVPIRCDDHQKRHVRVRGRRTPLPRIRAEKQKKQRNGDHKIRVAEIHLSKIAKLDRAEKRDSDAPAPELGLETQDAPSRGRPHPYSQGRSLESALCVSSWTDWLR
jgi:hypothetical protein